MHTSPVPVQAALTGKPEDERLVQLHLEPHGRGCTHLINGIADSSKVYSREKPLETLSAVQKGRESRKRTSSSFERIFFDVPSPTTTLVFPQEKLATHR